MNFKMHLLWVSLQSRLSANHKDDNEIIPRAMHRSPDILSKADKNPWKPQLGDDGSRLCDQVITSNGLQYP